MSCKVIAIDDFKRDAKKLLKKFISLKSELIQLEADLLQNPRLGTLIQENTYKIRLAVKSKGKSGGMRIVTHVVEVMLQINEDTTEQDFTVFLLTIYDKSEMENIADNDLQYLINQVCAELDSEDREL